MSLQSRLDIICDEAYGDVGPKDDASPEASDGISTNKPVSQLVLHFLRFVSCIFVFICFFIVGESMLVYSQFHQFL